MKKAPKKVIAEKKAGKKISRNGLLFFFAAIVILFYALYQAIDLKWVSDDAFITFRYVKNFVAGNGIVYNVGEYAEGYTHFLWLMILSAAKFIGTDPVSASIWLGIFFYGSTVLLLLLISNQKRNKNSGVFYFPLAAALIAVNYDAQVWASGGLETAFYTFELSLAFYFWFFAKLSWRKRLLVTGSTLLLATLTRPDGALFVITAILLLAALRRKAPLKEIADNIFWLILPALIIGIPYLFWKYKYYGDILPATYYAKSAGENYFAQGFFYIFLFFKVYVSLAIAVVGLGALYFFRKGKNTVEINTTVEHLGSPAITACTAICVYLVLNVARVGGDFMFARFIIPILPLLCYIIEDWLWRLQLKPKIEYAIAGLLVGSIFLENMLREKILFHYDQATAQLAGNWDGNDGGETRGIADERWVYMRKRFLLNGELRGSMDVYSSIGKFYQPFFAGLPVTIAITGAQNMIAYYADFHTCINEYGLTDTAIAHQPITKRGRIGHEKMASEEYFVKRGVQLQFFAVMNELPKGRTWDMAAFEIPEYGLWQIAKVITYDKPIIDELFNRFRAVGIRTMLPKYDMIMPRYITDVMPSLPVEQVKDDYEGFKRLFFNRYPDPAAQKKIEDYIALKSKR